MSDDVRGSALVLACNREGRILQVGRSEPGLNPVGPHARLFDLLDRGSVEKGRSFLDAISHTGAAFDWEINVCVYGKPCSFFFGGVNERDRLLIVASRTRLTLIECMEQMKSLILDSAELPSTVHSQALRARMQAERDTAFLDQLMQFNNELSNLQRELAKKNSELTRINEEKNRILGMAAHDLRNPLGVIMTYSELLQEDAWPVLTDAQREFLTTIHNSSKYMLGLIDDVLDVTRIEAGKLDLELAPADLGDLVRSIVVLNRPIASRKQIALNLMVAGDLPLMQLDLTRFAQVIDNLISNAIKYSFSGSSVQISVEQGDQSLILSVADPGQGIPAEDQKNLFKPFSRMSPRGTAGEKSTGLGLAIVRKIVLAHGGDIQVESTPGKGSIFTVVLPVMPVEHG